MEFHLGSVSYHEHVKLIQDSEGAVSGCPEGEQEAHSGVGSLSTREGSCVCGHSSGPLHLSLWWQ